MKLKIGWEKNIVEVQQCSMDLFHDNRDYTVFHKKTWQSTYVNNFMKS